MEACERKTPDVLRAEFLRSGEPAPQREAGLWIRMPFNSRAKARFPSRSDGFEVGVMHRGVEEIRTYE